MIKEIYLEFSVMVIMFRSKWVGLFLFTYLVKIWDKISITKINIPTNYCLNFCPSEMVVKKNIVTIAPEKKLHC